MVAIVIVALDLLSAGLWMSNINLQQQVQSAPPPSPTLAAPPATTPDLSMAAPEQSVPVQPIPEQPAPDQPAQADQPAPADIGNIDLAGWKLTIPEAGEHGSAANITPAASYPPWLVRDGNGYLRFWAPVAGVTTPNSTHARTELDSLHNFRAGSGQHTLSASVSVDQVPSGTQDVILGQIHGADDISSVPFVMLHYQAGTIKVSVRERQDDKTTTKYPLLSQVPLGARFDYTITDLGTGNLIFSATYGSTTQQTALAIPDAYRNATVRFQAGNYQQGESSSGADDGARVTFYALAGL